jgi:hypothetical protein
LSSEVVRQEKDQSLWGRNPKMRPSRTTTTKELLAAGC